jgi:hypothetical protein
MHRHYTLPVTFLRTRAWPQNPALKGRRLVPESIAVPRHPALESQSRRLIWPQEFQSLKSAITPGVSLKAIRPLVPRKAILESQPRGPSRPLAPLQGHTLEFSLKATTLES